MDISSTAPADIPPTEATQDVAASTIEPTITILDSELLPPSTTDSPASIPTLTETSNATPIESEPLASTSSLLPPPPAPVPVEAQVITFISTSPTGKTRNWFAKYYSPSSNLNSRNPFEDLPESYFNPTSFELQGAFNGMEKKRSALIDAPLLTQALRDRANHGKTREKVGRWPQTRIRVRFGDRSLLEGIFKSTDSMLAIYEFVKFSLEEKFQSVPFVLYQTPPKMEYKKGDPALKGKNLMDLQFTPSSVFYIKFEEDSLNTSGIPPLLPSILAAIADLPAPAPLEGSTPVIDKPILEIEKKPKLGANGKIMPNWMKKAKTGKS